MRRLAFVLACSTVGAQEQVWEGAERAGIAKADLATLRRDGLLVSDQAFKAVFDAYLDTPEGLTGFVTSDSLLAAYHSLFEASMVSLERQRADRLPVLLKELEALVPDDEHAPAGSPELLAAARRRMQLVLAVARVLADPAVKLDPALAKSIAPGVAALRRGRGVVAPDWLGPYDEHFVGIDASRCRLRGPYADSPQLAGYFRACAWLQAVPFRVDRDAELLGMCVLGRAVFDSRSYSDAMATAGFFGAFEDIVGVRDDWDLAVAIDASASIPVRGRPVAEVLQAARTVLGKRGRVEVPTRIHDELRFPSDRPAPLLLRLLSAHRTPGSLLFTRTTSGELERRPFPTGLEVAALLGSHTAIEELGRTAPSVLAVIRAQGDLLAGDALHARGLRCLSTLCAGQDPAAPPLFRSAAWQRKTCNTVLASWAQARHAFALQAKISAGYLCRVSAPAMLVEPNPRFYSELANLTSAAWRCFERHGASTIDALREVERPLLSLWHELEITCRRLESLAHRQLRGLPFSEEEAGFLKGYGKLLARFFFYEGNSYIRPRDDTPVCVDVHCSPLQPQRYLHVGIGRARALYLLYPWQGHEVLCRGAVLPYYELESSTRLTDAQWRKRLDGADRPRIGAWLRPSLAAAGKTRPVLEKR